MKHLTKKDLLQLPNILIKNIPDPLNTKEHYQSFTIKKNRKSVKQSEIITYQPKTLQNPNIDLNQSLQNIQKLHINYPRL